MLVAGNPQHFGRLGELNTAEALAAALHLVGRPDEAHELLAGFAGGPAFLELNRERLERYARASSPEALVREERALFARS
jgi:pre-rRNA-processing protein TSR3